MANSTTDPLGAAPDDDPSRSATTEDNGASSRQANGDSSWGRWQWDHNDQYSSDWGSWDNSSWGWGDRWSWQPSYYYNNNRSVRHRDSPWGTGTTWSQSSQFYGAEQPNRREGDEEQRSNDTSEEQGASDATLPDEASQEHRRFSSATLGSSETTRAPSGRGRDEHGTSLSDASGTAGYKGSFSEKMAVPSFGAKGTGDELGMSARSYLRQVEAWSKVTRTDPTQQALLLYQNLSDRAWVESEELNVEDLASPQGLKVFTSWIRERYQEVEVSRIAEALTLFFKKMKRQAGQSIREFNSVFDRGHSRLLEIDCRLPEVARAWAYLNALGLSSSEELSLLASVGNDYSTAKLQKAAILHEKSLRGPWVPRNKGDGKGAKSAYMAGVDGDEPQHGPDDVYGGDEQGPYLDEETAKEIHEAFVAQESAKARYRDVIKARGVDPETLKNGKKGAEESTKPSSDESLAQAKLRSYCAGCGRRGHWHKDAECPLNRAGNSAPKPRATQDHQVHATTASPGPPAGVVEVAYMVGDLGGDRLLAITDTACSKSVMDQKWLESYLRLAKETGVDTQFLDCHDDFRFGASRLFHANFSATIVIQIRDRVFMLRASVVQGEVPLLMSRGALSKLGMVYDLEGHSAQFKHLGIERFSLMTTDSGHPAIPVSPKCVPGMRWPSPQECANSEVIIVPSAPSQYVAFMTSASDARDAHASSAPLDPKENKTPSADRPPGQNIFYPKKINACARNLLSAESFNPQHFAAWWSKTPISKDFWIECADSFIRIHVVPRRGLFDPSRWETSQIEVKDKLLGSVGLVRSSHGISCSTLVGLDAIHDLWQDQRNVQHPVLWVGRTVFSRAVARVPIYGPPPIGVHHFFLMASSEPPANIWKMNKTQLLSEAVRLNLTVHTSWSVGEIRQIISDHRRSTEQDSSVPKGLASMTLEQLKTQASALQIPIPPRATKGQLQLLIRDASTREKAEAIVTFGRHRNKLYKEVPTQYLEWAMLEVRERGVESSGPDLVSLANYAKAKLRPEEVESYNPEINSRVPLPAESSTSSCWETHWSELTETAIQMNTRAGYPAKETETHAQQRTPTPKKRSTASGSQVGEKKPMDQEVPQEVREEIETLMARLAALKDRHGL